MMDLSNKTIQEIFYKKIRELTQKACADSFDLQFSERWL